MPGLSEIFTLTVKVSPGLTVADDGLTLKEGVAANMPVEIIAAAEADIKKAEINLHENLVIFINFLSVNSKVFYCCFLHSYYFIIAFFLQIININVVSLL